MRGIVKDNVFHFNRTNTKSNINKSEGYFRAQGSRTSWLLTLEDKHTRARARSRRSRFRRFAFTRALANKRIAFRSTLKRTCCQVRYRRDHNNNNKYTQLRMLLMSPGEGKRRDCSEQTLAGIETQSGSEQKEHTDDPRSATFARVLGKQHRRCN